jgi:hypothetical protein
MLHWSVGVLSGSFGPEARVTINVPASQRWYQPSEPGAITTPTLLDAVEATSTTVTAMMLAIQATVSSRRAPSG